jgi:ribosomal protein S18 acetylase RimI-like enzyme
MIIRDMHEAEAQAVADKVHGLARDLSLGVTPNLTGPKLLAARELVNVVVAAEDDKLLGACLWLMTFSTFRAAKGMYVVDLFVDATARNRNIGFGLLQGAAQRAIMKGATFIKLEVDTSNESGARFYERIGFKKKNEDRLFILEQKDLNNFTREKS